VKSADVSACGGGKAECALAHFVSGLVGKSNSADIVHGDARIDESGDATGYDACFAAARPGDYKQGTIAVKYGLLLGWS
jgi:hypothetical protein